jgi:hypothetical protein
MLFAGKLPAGRFRAWPAAWNGYGGGFASAAHLKYYVGYLTQVPEE